MDCNKQDIECKIPGDVRLADGERAKALARTLTKRTNTLTHHKVIHSSNNKCTTTKMGQDPRYHASNSDMYPGYISPFISEAMIRILRKLIFELILI